MSSPPASPPPVPAEPAWGELIGRALAGGVISTAYQPIVDVARGCVVGYEALARFDGQPVTDPHAWFQAARSCGVAAELEALALRSALRHRPSLPANCFLSVNVSPDLIGTSPVRAVLDGEGDLGALVIELTEDARVDSYADLALDLRRLRAAGAVVAVDDAGAGYAGLSHLLEVRPGIIKLDRQLITDIDRDEAKRALVELIGAFSSRIDAWLLAEGVETTAELDVIASLGVPLVQGYLVGRPAPPWSAMPEDVALRLIAAAAPQDGASLRRLLEVAPTAQELNTARTVLAADAAVDAVVMVDHLGRPVGLADPSSIALRAPARAMLAHLDTPVHEAARRSLTRQRWELFLPIVCTDSAGRYVGIVRIERLIGALAEAVAS